MLETTDGCRVSGTYGKLTLLYPPKLFNVIPADVNSRKKTIRGRGSVFTEVSIDDKCRTRSQKVSGISLYSFQGARQQSGQG